MLLLLAVALYSRATSRDNDGVRLLAPESSIVRASGSEFQDLQLKLKQGAFRHGGSINDDRSKL